MGDPKWLATSRRVWAFVAMATAGGLAGLCSWKGLGCGIEKEMVQVIGDRLLEVVASLLLLWSLLRPDNAQLKLKP